MLFKKKKSSVTLNEVHEQPARPEVSASAPNQLNSAEKASGSIISAAGKPSRAQKKAVWRSSFARLGAGIIDSAILFVPLAIIVCWRTLAYANANSEMYATIPDAYSRLALLLGYTALICFARVPLLSLVLLPLIMLFALPHWFLPIAVAIGFEVGYWLYSTLLESSPQRGTVGKKLLGLDVTGKSEERISFGRASARHFAKPLSALSLLLPGLGVWLNSGQLLHDKISNCLIDGAPDIVPPPPTAPTNVLFAPLWRRVGAAAIDAVLILSAEALLSTMLVLALLHLYQPSDQTKMLVEVVLLIPIGLLPLAAPMLAMAALEWSALQATPGKLIFGLKVTSDSGDRITFWSSAYKQLVHYGLWLTMWPIFAVGYIAGYIVTLLFFPTACRSPYFLVGYFALTLLFYGGMLCLTFRGPVKQSLADRIAHRFVIKRSLPAKQQEITAEPIRLDWLPFKASVATALTLVVGLLWYAIDLRPREQAANRAYQNVLRTSEVFFSDGWRGGWLTKTGKMVTPEQGVDVRSFSENCFPARVNGKWGFMDNQGNWLIKPRFDNAREFSDGLAPVATNDHWGLIDKKGNWVVPAKFDGIQRFSQGFAAARKGLYSGYIDRKGNWIVKPCFSAAFPFSDGFAAAQLADGQWTFVHSSGVMTKPRYYRVRSFSEGLAAVEEDNKWGYINTSGKWVIPPVYSSCGPFQNGRALVRKDKKSLLIDKQGKVLCSGTRLIAISTPSMVALPAFTSNKEVGYVDASGKFVLQPELAGMQPFMNGVAFAYKKGQRHLKLADYSHSIYNPQVSSPTDEEEEEEED